MSFSDNLNAALNGLLHFASAIPVVEEDINAFISQNWGQDHVKQGAQALTDLAKVMGQAAAVASGTPLAGAATVAATAASAAVAATEAAAPAIEQAVDAGSEVVKDVEEAFSQPQK